MYGYKEFDPWAPWRLDVSGAGDFNGDGFQGAVLGGEWDDIRKQD